MTTTGAKVSDMVYELYRPDKDDKEGIKLEILFFHGLQFGSLEAEIYLSTWKSGDLQEIWPKTWLPKEFPGARILAIRYDSSIIITKDSGRFDLHNAAESLALELVDHAKVGQSDACPVIFVGHGVGGLLIKQLCLHVDQKSRWAQESVKMNCLLRNIKGLFFYGTPHRGMPGHDGITMKNPSPLMEFVNVLGPDAARLEANLEELRQRYRWVVGGVGETKETCLARGNQRPSWLQFILTRASSGSRSQDDFYGIVVPEASARYGGGFTVVDADHFTLCQPETQKSNSYLNLVAFVRQVTAKEGETRKRPHSRRSLGTYVPLPDIEASIRKALDEEDVLLLHGNPGSGKSTLARYIRYHYLCSPHELQWRNKGATRSSRDFIVDESRKLIIVLLECGRKADVASKRLELLQTLGPSASSSKFHGSDQSVLIKQEIRSLLEMQKTLVILDDVWEQRFIEAFVADLAFDLHDQVKFLFTSRNSAIWKASTAIEVPPVSLEKAEQILAAHAGIADHELPSDLKGIAARLIKRAEGNPLALAMAGWRITKTKNTISKEWKDVASSYSTAVEGKMKGKDTSPSLTPVFDCAYERNIGESLLMTYQHLSENSRRLLILIANCEGKTIPSHVVRRLYTKVQEGEYPMPFRDHLNELRENGTMLQADANLIVSFDPKLAISSSEPYAVNLCESENLGFHDLQRKFTNMHNETRKNVMEVMDSLLDTCRGRASLVQNITDEHRSASQEVLGLCILYLRKRYAERAAKHLDIRDPDFNLFKELRVALGPLVIVMCEQLSEEEKQKNQTSESEEESSESEESNQPSRRESEVDVDLDKLICCAKQVMIKIVCNGELQDDSLAPLLSSFTFGPAIASVLNNLGYTKLKSALRGHIPVTIQSLMNSLHGDISLPPQIRAIHLRCLSMLAWFPGPGQEIQACPGFIEALVNSYWLDREEFSIYIADTLIALGYHVTGRKRIGEVHGAIPKLISLVLKDHPNMALQEAFAEALINLQLDESNQKQFLEHPGALEGLVNLLDGEKSSRVHRALAITLTNVATKTAGAERIGEVPGAIPKLLLFLHKYSGNIALQQVLLGTLSNLTLGNESNRKQVEEHPGALEVLVKLLDGEKSSKFLRYLAGTLVNVVAKTEGAEKIGEIPGAVPKLLSLIQKDSGDIVLQDLLMSLFHLTLRHPSNRKQIVEHPSAVGGLLSLLDAEKSSLFLGCLARTLAIVTLETEGREKIGEIPGAVLKLLSLIHKHSGDIPLQEALSATLYHLTLRRESNRRQIAEHPGAVEGLMSLLNAEKSSFLLRGLVGTLMSVTAETEGAEKIGEIPGAVPKLLSLIHKDSGDIALQEVLMGTLYHMTYRHASNRRQIVEHPGAVEGLLSLLDAEKSSTLLRNLTAALLLNVTNQTEGAEEIGEISGAVPKLLSLT